MTSPNGCIDKLFRDARTHGAWLAKPVSDETLRELYDALKWGPTSANASPARFVFIRTAKGKERLRPSLAPGNVDKTMAAPVTVIVAYDLQFHNKLPKLFPHNPGMRDLFVANPALVEVTARRNSSLQGAYLILAARAPSCEACFPACFLARAFALAQPGHSPRVRRRQVDLSAACTFAGVNGTERSRAPVAL